MPGAGIETVSKARHCIPWVSETFVCEPRAYGYEICADHIMKWRHSVLADIFVYSIKILLIQYAMDVGNTKIYGILYLLLYLFFLLKAIYVGI